jgi:hypothetical protein
MPLIASFNFVELVLRPRFVAKQLFGVDSIDNYWFGGGVRTSGTIIAIAGFTMESLNVGYSFDYTLSNLRKHSYGSHEFMIAFKFGDSARRYRWLERY